MKAHLIDTHLLVPRSRSFAKVKVKYQCHVSQKMGVSGAVVFHKHILFSSPMSHFHLLLHGDYLLATKDFFTINPLLHNPDFNDLEKESFLKTLWEQKKMLVTSNFSSLQQCFLPFKNQISFFLAHLSTTCSRGAFRVTGCPIVRRQQFFKHQLLLNRWANLDQTWQECSLGGPL